MTALDCGDGDDVVFGRIGHLGGANLAPPHERGGHSRPNVSERTTLGDLLRGSHLSALPSYIYETLTLILGGPPKALVNRKSVISRALTAF